MDLGLEGRVALVTGASQGIGRGIAAGLVAEGARVAVASRSLSRIEQKAQEIGAQPFVFDTSRSDDADELVSAVEVALGPVDVLVPNTGGPPPGEDALGFSGDQWEQAYRQLVLGPMALIERVVPGMRERRFGRIVNVSSVAVREPIPTLMLSNSHRAAMLAAFKTVARQIAGDGVTLNTVLPGLIATERAFANNGGSREAAQAVAAESVPAGRLGEVEELAAMVVFLSSAPASYVTGTAVRVDGGRTQSV